MNSGTINDIMCKDILRGLRSRSEYIEVVKQIIEEGYEVEIFNDQSEKVEDAKI
jgi:hypothetical protein